MRRTFLRRASAIAIMAGGLLAGCAATQDMTVIVPPHSAAASGSALAAVSQKAVTVTPFTINRGIGVLPGRIGERTTVGDVTMGYVTLSPPPEALMTQAITTELQTAGHRVSGGPSRVTGRVNRFALSTPATATYWDVTIDASVTVDVNGTARTYDETCIQRTFAWPSQDLIAGLTKGCVDRIATRFSRDRRAANAL